MRINKQKSNVFFFISDQVSVMFRNSVSLLISTVKHMKHLNQLLLIPLTIWSGLEQSFLGAQFTKVNFHKNFESFKISLGFCFMYI
jgi:hypothetical protein